MLRSSEKHFVRRFLFGKIGLVLLLIVFVLFARGTWGVYKKSIYAKQNHDQDTQELQRLEERETALAQELARLDTPRGLEEEIRHKFDVGHEGEELIVLVDAPEQAVVPVAVEPRLWDRIVNFFSW